MGAKSGLATTSDKNKALESFLRKPKINQLSERLRRRLQFATFKVLLGWQKYNIEQVSELWRACGLHELDYQREIILCSSFPKLASCITQQREQRVWSASSSMSFGSSAAGGSSGSSASDFSASDWGGLCGGVGGVEGNGSEEMDFVELGESVGSVVAEIEFGTRTGSANVSNNTNVKSNTHNNGGAVVNPNNSMSSSMSSVGRADAPSVHTKTEKMTTESNVSFGVGKPGSSLHNTDASLLIENISKFHSAGKKNGVKPPRQEATPPPQPSQEPQQRSMSPEERHQQFHQQNVVVNAMDIDPSRQQQAQSAFYQHYYPTQFVDYFRTVAPYSPVPESAKLPQETATAFHPSSNQQQYMINPSYDRRMCEINQMVLSCPPAPIYTMDPYGYVYQHPSADTSNQIVYPQLVPYNCIPRTTASTATACPTAPTFDTSSADSANGLKQMPRTSKASQSIHQRLDIVKIEPASGVIPNVASNTGFSCRTTAASAAASSSSMSMNLRRTGYEEASMSRR